MKYVVRTLLILLGVIASSFVARAYDRANYRKGEIIRLWPQHGVWQLGLRSGGQSGTDDCVIGASVGAQSPAFYLTFIFDGGAFSNGRTLNFSDGGMMQVEFKDLNLLAANDQNFDRYKNVPDSAVVKMSVDGWQFFERQILRQTIIVQGEKWSATSFPFCVAWDMPNPDDAMQSSTLDILNRMRAGKYLVVQSWLMSHHIPLAGFDLVLDEFSQCTAMQKDGVQ